MNSHKPDPSANSASQSTRPPIMPPRPRGWRIWILTVGHIGFSRYMPGTLASAAVLGGFILATEILPFLAVQILLPVLGLIAALLGFYLAPYAQCVFVSEAAGGLEGSNNSAEDKENPAGEANNESKDDDESTGPVMDKDPQAVVIDEVAGMALSLLPLLFITPAGVGEVRYLIYALAAFGFFRLFDIVKPGWIGRLNVRSESRYIMLDDIAAGGLAALVMYSLIIL